MVLKRGRKTNVGLEALAFLPPAEPGEATQKVIGALHQSTVAAFDQALSASLANPSRLHGHRTQYAFEDVVLALGVVRLLKTEDSGSYAFEDSYGELLPADYRIVLRDGTMLLVEVKSVAPGNDGKVRIRAKAMDAANSYARATSARLLYAHYWAGPNLWTLVPPEAFNDGGNYRRLTLPAAMAANEMYLLGDWLVGTRPPLTFSLLVDPDQEQADPGGDANQRVVTIAGVELFASGSALDEAVEKDFAWLLIRYGGWAVQRSVHEDALGRVARIDFNFAPDVDEDTAREIAAQGFAIVGALSSLATARFTLATSSQDGEISALRDDIAPGTAVALIPEEYWARDHSLKVWRLNVKPARSTEATS